jgi:hypothetical protein
MKPKAIVFLGSLLCLFAITAMAAEVTGKWVATVQGRSGMPRQHTFSLKAEGNTLTGTVSGFRGGGEENITEGKVNGNEISFAVMREFQGQSVKMLYKGTVTGDTMKLNVSREGGQGPGREITATRAK